MAKVRHMCVEIIMSIAHLSTEPSQYYLCHHQRCLKAPSPLRCQRRLSPVGWHQSLSSGMTGFFCALRSMARCFGWRLLPQVYARITKHMCCYGSGAYLFYLFPWVFIIVRGFMNCFYLKRHTVSCI